MASSNYRFSKLAEHHDSAGFSCGVDQQDRFIRRALAEQSTGMHVVHVAFETAQPSCILGFFSLSMSTKDRTDKVASPKALRSGLPNIYGNDIPCLHLGQLARDKFAPAGFGKVVLGYSILCALAAADLSGAVALSVHAGDEDLISYYLSAGFTQVGETTELFLLMEDARHSFPDYAAKFDEMLVTVAP